MNERVLVAYASISGSTTEVAEVVAQKIREQGAQAFVRNVNDVESVTEYDAVIVGSSIRGGLWLESAYKFVADFAETLRDKKVALFTTCLTMVGDEIEGRKRVLAYMEPVLAIDKQIQPIGLGLFSGSLVPALQTIVPGSVYGDHRNWSAIKRWAAEIASLLVEQDARKQFGDDLMGMILSYSDLSYSDLHQMNLRDAQLDHTDLSLSDLHNASLNWSNLTESSLVDADLSGANLIGAKLARADLSGAEMSGAILNGATLTAANLSDCNLQNADLNWAELAEADLSRAKLTGATLGWANLEGANLKDADLKGAHYNAYTRWPEGFSSQEAGCVNMGDAPF